MQNNNQIKLNLPGSRSITNRNLIIASLTKAIVKLSRIWISNDSVNMMNALKNLGVKIDLDWNNVVLDSSNIEENLIWKQINLNVWLSGTSIRFLTWLISVLNKDNEIIIQWENRLNNRPIWDLVKALKDIWFNIECRDNNYPPVVIKKTDLNKLKNKVSISGKVSSQYISALLMIAPALKNWLEINIEWKLVSKPYIDMTINEMLKFWVSVINSNYKSFKVLNSKYIAKNITVEWDASALSYIANYVLLNKLDSKYKTLEISNIWDLTKQWDYQYLKVLKKYFGLEYESNNNKTVFKLKDYNQNPSLTTFLKIKGDIEVNFENMPDVSMSFISIVPILISKLSRLDSIKIFKITWLQTLNHKECERINVIISELIKLWVDIFWDEKSVTIKSWFNLDWIKEVSIETFDDHRIAMTFWVLKTYLEKHYDIKINILDPDCVEKTYPDFWKDIEYLEKKGFEINLNYIN